MSSLMALVVNSVALVVASLLWLGGAAHAIAIDVGSATGRPGQIVEVDISIIDVGQLNVVALESKIAFTDDAAVVALADRRADCFLNPGIDKDFITSFSPAGCTPGTDGCLFRGIVGRFDPTDPTTLDPICFNNQCLLYTCRVRISSGASVGQYPLECVDPILSDRNGVRIPAGCSSGTVTVLAPLPTPSPTPSGGGGGGGGGGCQIAPTSTSTCAGLLLAPILFILLRRRGQGCR